MLDDFLKDDDETANFLDSIDDEEELFELPSKSDYGFMGMSAGQRFIVSILIMFVTVLAGAFFLLVTGSIALPSL
jgi:hypothetical protein